MSTMLPSSVPRGANIVSSASVAALMNFIVTIGVWMTGILASSAAARSSASGLNPRLKITQGTL